MSRPSRHRRAGRWAAAVAVTGTVLIGVGAFWLSFTALSDLARLAGVPEAQSWAWAAIVDGVIVTSTVAVVSLDGAGWRATWFPWALLAGSAGVSVFANIMHAIVAADGRVSAALAGALAAVPPLVLLAMTHLTVIVVRHTGRTEPGTVPAPEVVAEAAPAAVPSAGIARSGTARRAPLAGRQEAALRVEAERLRAEEKLSNRKIAVRLGVHRSTVGRWLPTPYDTPDDDGDDTTETAPARTATGLRQEEGVPA